jgi:hypothetical protein
VLRGALVAVAFGGALECFDLKGTLTCLLAGRHPSWLGSRIFLSTLQESRVGLPIA